MKHSVENFLKQCNISSRILFFLSTSYEICSQNNFRYKSLRKANFVQKNEIKRRFVISLSPWEIAFKCIQNS